MPNQLVQPKPEENTPVTWPARFMAARIVCVPSALHETVQLVQEKGTFCRSVPLKKETEQARLYSTA